MELQQVRHTTSSSNKIRSFCKEKVEEMLLTNASARMEKAATSSKEKRKKNKKKKKKKKRRRRREGSFSRYGRDARYL
tara:strand:+ start:729 stop:962 length:234 start_codon:yes stop_codon:yes gene_type:complete